MYIFNVPKIEGEIVMLKSTLFFSIRLKKWTQTKNKNKKNEWSHLYAKHMEFYKKVS